MRKLLIRLIIFLIIVSFVAYKARNIIVKFGIEGVIEKFTSLEIKIDKVDVNISDHNFKINGLKLNNPQHFQNEPMLSMPVLYLDYNVSSLLRERKIHFNVLRIDISELLIERNAEGHLNFMSVAGADFSSAKRTKTNKGTGFKIDRLYLSIGDVLYNDYYKKNTPITNVYHVNLRNEVFENIDSKEALVSTIVHRALLRTGIHNILHYNLNILSANMEDVISRGGVIVKDFADEISQTSKSDNVGIKETIKNLFTKEKE